jgi:hypothetical protein
VNPDPVGESGSDCCIQIFCEKTYPNPLKNTLVKIFVFAKSVCKNFGKNEIFCENKNFHKNENFLQKTKTFCENKNFARKQKFLRDEISRKLAHFHLLFAFTLTSVGSCTKDHSLWHCERKII